MSTAVSRSLLDAVRAVGKQAAERAPEIEALRRLPDDLASALVDTGLLKAWVPARYGGGELDPLTVLDAFEELAWHDGSTGWCGMIAGTTGLAAARVVPEWAERIYGDPRAVTGGFAMPVGSARPVDGGLLVNGRWQWGSGAHHCTWLGGGCWVVDADGKPAEREDGLLAPFVFFEPEQVELLDTWYVSGLKGTGSTDFQVHDAFVPEGRWLDVVGSKPFVDVPLYRFPFFGSLALGVCAVALGLAHRAIDELVALAGGKRPSQSSRTLAERPVAQLQVAQAEAAWRSARAFVREAVAEAWDAAQSGDELTVEHRRRIRLAATDATWRSARAVDIAYSAGGGSSLREDNALQRVFRDIHAVTQHGIVAERTYETVGRLGFGLETDTTTL